MSSTGEKEREQTVPLMEFDLLSQFGRADLLDLFARRADSTLRERLADNLIRVVGPQRGQWRTHPEREPALTVLLRVSGEAFCRVLRAYLADADIWARSQAVQSAKWYADDALLEDIAAAASADYPPDVDPRILRIEAARVLAGYAQFAGLLSLARVIGPQLPLDMGDWLREEFAVEQQVVDAALNGVRTGNETIAQGSLLLLAIAKAEAGLDEALRVLESASDNTTRLLAMAAIGLCGSHDSRAVAAIVPHLRDEELRSAAVRALGQMDSTLATDALAASLSHAWDDNIAIHVGRGISHRDEIGHSLAQRISHLVSRSERQPLFFHNTLTAVLALAPDDLLDDVLRRCDAPVHDILRESALRAEGSSWIAGSKRDAIRGLSFVDPDAARIAAAVALDNREARDRPLYPSLLYRLDGVAAREQFLRLAHDEVDAAVLSSMAYALDPMHDAVWLRERVGAYNGQIRIAACRLTAGPCGQDTGVEDALRSAVDDPLQDVADEAVSSLRHIQAQREASRLATSLPPDTPQARVAVVAEAALAVGDVGFEQAAVPRWVKDLVNAEPLRQFRTLGQITEDRISKSRKEAAKRAERDAKRARGR